jgi:hypothetical protein
VPTGIPVYDNECRHTGRPDKEAIVVRRVIEEDVTTPSTTVVEDDGSWIGRTIVTLVVLALLVAGGIWLFRALADNDNGVGGDNDTKIENNIDGDTNDDGDTTNDTSNDTTNNVEPTSLPS